MMDGQRPSYDLSVTQLLNRWVCCSFSARFPARAVFVALCRSCYGCHAHHTRAALAFLHPTAQAHTCPEPATSKDPQSTRPGPPQSLSQHPRGPVRFSSSTVICPRQDLFCLFPAQFRWPGHQALAWRASGFTEGSLGCLEPKNSKAVSSSLWTPETVLLCGYPATLPTSSPHVPLR